MTTRHTAGLVARLAAGFSSFALAFTMTATPAAAQVTNQDLLAGPGDNWLTYTGDYAAQRHSPLKQITRDNVASMVPVWTYHIDTARRLSTMPIQYDGLVYVTNSNEVHALDARSGRRVWLHRQEQVQLRRPSRGSAILGDKIFFVTGDCHLVAIHRKTGALIWDQAYANPDDGYHCTVAPMPIKDKILAGVSGGDSGMRGFLAAFSAETGEEAWRFWTIPAKGEPGSETWGEKTLAWGGAGTWMPGSYDPELDVIYWPTGNPWPDFYGGDRPGDNLYTDSVIALNPDTGKLKWYFQFTPHDVWDWDAQEFNVLLDLPYKGQPRKVLVHADRNGYYYILDRVTGEFLQATPFVDKLNWAEGIDSKGRPILIPGREPRPEGVETCPTVRGASNWMSPSYNPETGLLYIVALEGCDIYVSSAKEPEPKVNFAGTGGGRPPRDENQFFLRALNPMTGERVWQYPMTGPTEMWAGTVSTAGGIVFFGDDDNHVVAVDAKDGRHLWHYNVGQPLFSSPITYMVDGKQYVTISTETDIFTFGLFEPAKPVPAVPEKREPLPTGGQR